MEEFFTKWFQGLEEALGSMSEGECIRLFTPCAARCGQDALKYLYRDLFRSCEGDLDAFFSRLHEIDNVDGSVLQPGREYEILFQNCGCDLHTQAKVRSPKLCICSRQSILWILNQLVPEKEFPVAEQETILGGASHCRFSISVQE